MVRVFRIARVRSRAQAAGAVLPDKGKLAAEVFVFLGSLEDDGEQWLGDVLNCPDFLWVLALTFCVVRCFEVTHAGEQVAFYLFRGTLREIESIILEMRTACSDASLLACVMKVKQNTLRQSGGHVQGAWALAALGRLRFNGSGCDWRRDFREERPLPWGASASTSQEMLFHRCDWR